MPQIELAGKLSFTQQIIVYQVCAHVAERWPMQHTETMVRLAVERTAQLALADHRAALARVLPVLPVMARTFPRSGIDFATPIAQQVYLYVSSL